MMQIVLFITVVYFTLALGTYFLFSRLFVTILGGVNRFSMEGNNGFMLFPFPSCNCMNIVSKYLK